MVISVWRSRLSLEAVLDLIKIEVVDIVVVVEGVNIVVVVVETEAGSRMSVAVLVNLLLFQTAKCSLQTLNKI
jgi:hypothetical protein